VKFNPIAFVLITCSTLTYAQAFERTPVADARDLMIAAIESPTGAAAGVLAGDMADAITQRFKASSPIYIDVSTERRYKQAGCSRLKVLFWQEGVLLPGAALPQKQTLEMGINYCRDGLPPKSLS
jgi:hypothetical protein